MAVGDVTLRIRFVAIPAVDDSINVKALFSSTEFNRTETFKTLRLFSGQSTIGASVAETAENYAAAFELDYLGFGVLVDGNDVLITIPDSSTFEYFTGCVISSSFATYDFGQIDNVIHVINFTSRSYQVPSILAREFLLTEDNDFLITEDGDNIRL